MTKISPTSLWSKGLFVSFILSLLLLCIVVSQLLYMQGKASLAQFFMNKAWQEEKLQQVTGIKPWPWADMYPVAELELPSLGKSIIVANTDSGQALAFAPGFNGVSDDKTYIISAHNDTHFKQLDYLKIGDELKLSLLTNERLKSRDFIVASIDIFDIREGRMLIDKSSGEQQLILITCYPFDTNRRQSTQRLVITAIKKQELNN